MRPTRNGHFENALKVAAGAAQGRRHETDNEPCQDVASTYLDAGIAVVALADGAGSASQSRRGAQLAVKNVIRTLRDEFAQLLQLSEVELKDRIVACVQRSLQRAAAGKNVSPVEYAATLLFAASDGARFFIGQLGDGRIAGFNAGTEKWQPMFAPCKGEFFNETAFVTSSNAAGYLNVMQGSISDFPSFVLMSDGAEDSLFNRPTGNFAPAVQTMVEWVAAYRQKEVEKSLAFNLKNAIRTKTLDDVSIAILTVGNLNS